ncbi:hypothetical protein [Spirulina major]|uniref:hypothetical protein n=1 Tax=Spirulina major TaxID=270636 RepID=UPI000934F8F9|nr:hypothetical protein [Spirulina major]
MSYDFACFLYEADCFFKEKGYNQFHVIIVSIIDEPQPWEEKLDYLKVIGDYQKRQRISNILVPLGLLYQACASTSLINDPNLIIEISQKRHNIYPENYGGLFLLTMDYNKVYDYERKKTNFSGFKASTLDLEKVNFWLSSQAVNRPFVTFTIRHYQYQKERNSNIPAYIEFSQHLKTLGISSVFIPDAEDISYLEQICSYPIFFAGAFNLYQRQAIYELAMTNIFNSNGCHVLCALNQSCSYIMSGIVNKYWSKEAHEARGLKYDAQPFCENRGVWEWESETFASLKKSFDLLLKKNPDWLASEK